MNLQSHSTNRYGGTSQIKESWQSVVLFSVFSGPPLVFHTTLQAPLPLKVVLTWKKMLNMLKKYTQTILDSRVWDFSTRSFFRFCWTSTFTFCTPVLPRFPMAPGPSFPPRCTNRTLGERIAAISRKEQCRCAKGCGHSPRNLAFCSPRNWGFTGGEFGTLQQLSCICMVYSK